jgi:hypothetical protein
MGIPIAGKKSDDIGLQPPYAKAVQGDTKG